MKGYIYMSEQKRKGLPYVTRRERRDVIASLNSMAHDMGCTVEEGNHVPEQNVKVDKGTYLSQNSQRSAMLLSSFPYLNSMCARILSRYF